MKKITGRLTAALSVFGLTAMILLFPQKSLSYAARGLNLWFQNMIPTLFPFMVLSGIMIRMNLTDSFVRFLKPALSPVFNVNSDCLYTIIIGFLCGFPMGACVAGQLYRQKKITRGEAEFLLAFCNNIGPVYFISFVIPLIRLTRLPALLIGMYGIPFLYGTVLRYTVYRSLDSEKGAARLLKASTPFLQALDESVTASLTSITKLGGYMILFNLMSLLPSLLLKNQTLLAVSSALLEISGGLSLLGDKAPLLSLSLLPFGGFSCIAQTYSMICDTDLSLKNYVLHKLVLTAVSFVYYSFLAAKSFGA